MKIALVSPYDWDTPGGVRSHIEHLASVFRQRGHTVRIITPSSGRHDHDIEYGLFRIGWVASVPINGSVARVAISPALTGALQRLLRNEQYDIVHLHEPMVSTLTLAMLRAAQGMGIPCIGTFHAATTRRTSAAAMAYSMASPFLQTSFRRLDACIAVSEAARENVGRQFDADYHIIPSGIDIEQFSPLVPPLPQFNDGARNVLFLSRIEPRKGLRYFLKAIPLIQEQFNRPGDPPLRFIIAGKGHGRMKYERFVQQMGWSGVVFTGYVPETEKPAYFASVDIYCAPATGSESQGIILLEAMATGTAIVASDIPGYRTVIPSAEYGQLVPPRDPERLAWAICHLLRQDGLRATLGANARQRAELYSWSRVAEAIEAVYDEGRHRHAQRLIAQRSAPRFFPQSGGPIGLPEPSSWAISPQTKNVVE